MKQSIEDQMKIMKAYAEGQTVYKRHVYSEVGEKLTEKDHQFNFESTVYSLTPMDWCTGRPAISAYELFMKNGSEKDDAPSSYNVCVGEGSHAYRKEAMDVVDTFLVFIAGAEWVIKNTERGIDFTQSLDDFRKRYREVKEEQLAIERNTISKSILDGR